MGSDISGKRKRILDVPVDLINRQEAFDIFLKLMEKEGCSLIVTPNSEIVVAASKDEEFKKIIESADLIIPDGIGLVYASRILGMPLKERVTGIDFLNDILAYLAKTEKSIFLFGSKPGVAEKAGEKMKLKYPGLKVAGTHNGYFKKEEESGIVDMINNSGADFLCVALGFPKQEKFIGTYKERLAPRVAVGVGGSLDVWAGTLKRAPDFYINHGLEWLYRLIQEPSRYKRMIVLPIFMLKVIANGRGGKKHGS